MCGVFPELGHHRGDVVAHTELVKELVGSSHVLTVCEGGGGGGGEEKEERNGFLAFNHLICFLNTYHSCLSPSIPLS